MQADYSSDTWHRLRRWVESELARAREKNDSMALDAVETAVLRGQIMAFKKILDLPNAAARGVSSEPDE